MQWNMEIYLAASVCREKGAIGSIPTREQIEAYREKNA